jgi:hypothetical protein
MKENERSADKALRENMADVKEYTNSFYNFILKRGLHESR